MYYTLFFLLFSAVKPSGGVHCCPFLGSDSVVVVDFLFIVTHNCRSL